jgi:hypothetical protein
MRGHLPGFRVLILSLSFALWGCEREGVLPLPSAEDLASYYEFAGDLTVAMSGNVPQVTVTVSREEYARGGELWAKAFPYLFLFTPGTRRSR